MSPRSPMRVALRCFASVLLSGCAGTPQRSAVPRPAQTVELEMEPIRITAHSNAGGSLTLEAYDASDLYERGTACFDAKQCDAAITYYDQLVDEFPESELVSPALFNAGLCMQATGAFAEAAARYRRLRAMRPDSVDFVYTTLRLAEVLIQLAEFTQAMAVADELLARTDLSPTDRLEALARRSQALLGLGRLDEAQAHAKGALRYFRTHRGPDGIRDEFFAAANNFVIAEAYRLRAGAVTFPRDVSGQKEALVRRAQWVLQAQRAYSDTIAFVNLDNYHWMTAAGYRLGQMYDELWQAVMAAPLPTQLEGEGDAAYHKELAALIKPLIRHAIRYWETTLLFVERIGLDNAWTEKIRADLSRVRTLMLEHPPGSGVLPRPETGPEGPRSRLRRLGHVPVVPYVSRMERSCAAANASGGAPRDGAKEADKKHLLFLTSNDPGRTRTARFPRGDRFALVFAQETGNQ